MPAVNLPLKLEQGASFDQSLLLEGADGLPINLTGYTGKGQMRPTFSSASKYDFEVGFNDDPTDGVVNISMSAINTALIEVIGTNTSDRKLTSYLYDIELTRPDGIVLRILEGMIQVSPEVTR